MFKLVYPDYVLIAIGDGCFNYHTNLQYFIHFHGGKINSLQKNYHNVIYALNHGVQWIEWGVLQLSSTNEAS